MSKIREKESLECVRMHIWASKTQKLPGPLSGPWTPAAECSLCSCDFTLLRWQLSASEAGAPPWPNPGSAPVANDFRKHQGSQFKFWQKQSLNLESPQFSAWKYLLPLHSLFFQNDTVSSNSSNYYMKPVRHELRLFEVGLINSISVWL